MSADLESNSKRASITIINDGLYDHDLDNLLAQVGYLVKQVPFVMAMIGKPDLIILGRDPEPQLSQGSDPQNLYEILKSEYADIPLILLKDYGDPREFQTSIFLRDVSDRLKYSRRIQELKQQNLHLASQLQKTRDASELAIKAKTEFLTRISHELRAPLNGILGFSQLMSWDKLLTTEQRGYTEIIYDSGKHLLSLVNDVLEMSKIESHHLEIDKKVFVLREMINDLKHIFSPKAERKNLELILKISPEVPICIHSDEVKLRQILVNILNNAIQSTNVGSITLSAFIASDILTKALHLVFEVEDTGAGIPHLEINAIFEPFIQTGVKFEDGTGLTLAISRHFASLLGGDLKVASNLDEGATFTLSMPVEILDKMYSLAGDRFKKSQEQKPNSSLKILLAEDSFVDQKVLVRILNQMGYAADVAGDGIEVLAALEHKTYNIILMDVQMPNMDGIEATKQILQKFGVENSPVIIAITAGAMPEDRSRCMEAGMNDYMTKPLRPKQLRAVLEHWEQKISQNIMGYES